MSKKFPNILISGQIPLFNSSIIRAGKQISINLTKFYHSYLRRMTSINIFQLISLHIPKFNSLILRPTRKKSITRINIQTSDPTSMSINFFYFFQLNFLLNCLFFPFLLIILFKKISFFFDFYDFSRNLRIFLINP